MQFCALHLLNTYRRCILEADWRCSIVHSNFVAHFLFSKPNQKLFFWGGFFLNKDETNSDDWLETALTLASQRYAWHNSNTSLHKPIREKKLYTTLFYFLTNYIKYSLPYCDYHKRFTLKSEVTLANSCRATMRLVKLGSLNLCNSALKCHIACGWPSSLSEFCKVCLPLWKCNPTGVTPAQFVGLFHRIMQYRSNYFRLSVLSSVSMKQVM